MKIAFYETKPWEQKILKKEFSGHRLLFSDKPLKSSSMPQARDADAVSVFIYSKLDRKLLSGFKKLRHVSTRSTGYDHIDIRYCRKRKITVSNVPYYGENTVAEHTFALILSLSRNIHKSYVRTLKGDFSIDGLTGFDLKGKTIGIIGGGHIGLHVARVARAFGLHVRVYDVQKDDFLAEVINFQYLPLEELLAVSDIITLHVPYNTKTHHLINRENIRKIKNGALLVNTARGAVVDTDALYWALKTGRLSGAGLDVIEGEELIKEEHELLHMEGNTEKWRAIVRDHRIFQMDNVVFTPHNAFNSKEALMRILGTSIENLKAALDGRQANLV